MNRFLCFVGLLAVMMSASLMMIDAQINNNEKMNDVVLDASSNNSSSTNISAKNFTNNISFELVADDSNLTAPGLSKSMSNVSINATDGPSQPVFEAVLEPAFTIGTGMKNNSSAYRLGGKTQITKNLSTMWYVVQATPHGYV